MREGGAGRVKWEVANLVMVHMTWTVLTCGGKEPETVNYVTSLMKELCCVEKQCQ